MHGRTRVAAVTYPVTLAEVARLFVELLGCAVETRGGKPVSSPAFANRKVIDARYIDRLTDPLPGMRSLLEEWKDRPWET